MTHDGKYSHTYTATTSDITPQYRLTASAMMMYFQDCFARLMTLHHVAAFDIVKQRRMWIITEFHIDVRPTVTYWSEDFTVELWVSELTSLRLYCDFCITRKTGELIASGTSQWNILNLDTRRLEATDFLAERLTVVPELMTAGHKKVRFPKPLSVDMQMQHRATRLDLDFNYHVSNRSYVSIALLTMPDEVLAAQTALRFLLQRGVVIIPKSTHKECMVENLNIFDFELTTDEMARIEALDTRQSLFFDHHDGEVTKMFMGWR